MKRKDPFDRKFVFLIFCLFQMMPIKVDPPDHPILMVLGKGNIEREKKEKDWQHNMDPNHHHHLHRQLVFRKYLPMGIIDIKSILANANRKRTRDHLLLVLPPWFHIPATDPTVIEKAHVIHRSFYPTVETPITGKI